VTIPFPLTRPRRAASETDVVIEPARTKRRWWRIARNSLVAFVVFLVIGNVTILVLNRSARARVGVDRIESIEGIHNLRVVDDRVWGGGNPTREGYEALARHGVTTVVDLRAEPYRHHDDEFIRAQGVEVVHLEIRDGQTPPDELVDRFVEIVAQSKGTVFLHCGAGVGRTGTVAAAYLVRTGQARPRDAMTRSLAVGPPSLEQLHYLRTHSRAPLPVVAVSRVLDAPRRIYSRVAHLNPL
jgi:protein-tyrosine phosphatase